jgi:RNA polymerase sigma-B factor
MARGSSRPADEQIEETFDRYRQTRDPSIRDRLVELHLPIADRCARRYVNRGEPMADLTQVARMALVRAVERFDPTRGVRFDAYAMPTITGELRHHFRDNCWIVSVPRRAKDLRTQVFRASEQVSQQLGRQPTTDEIAETLDLPEESVAMTLESNRHYRATSWESLIERRDHSTQRWGSALTTNSIEDSADRVDLARTIAKLDERLQQIVIWRFYEECTQSEIGARLGVGQVQVSRLLARAVRQLRQHVDLIGDETGAVGDDTGDVPVIRRAS